MKQYHAVMIDETGCEFGADVEANSVGEARNILEEDYPESRIDEIKTQEQWDRDQADREARLWAGDDDGYDRQAEYDDYWR